MVSIGHGELSTWIQTIHLLCCVLFRFSICQSPHNYHGYLTGIAKDWLSIRVHVATLMNMENKSITIKNSDITESKTMHIVTVDMFLWITVFSHDQRKHQSSASLAFVRGIQRWPVNSPHKGPVTRKMFPFDDVIVWECHGASFVITGGAAGCRQKTCGASSKTLASRQLSGVDIGIVVP